MSTVEADTKTKPKANRSGRQKSPSPLYSLPGSKGSLKLSNVLASAETGLALNLRLVCARFINSEYMVQIVKKNVSSTDNERVRLPSTRVRLTEGKLLVVGCRTIEATYGTLRRVCKHMMDVIDPGIRFYDFTVRRIWATYTVPTPNGVQLESLHRSVPASAYESDVSFPKVLIPTKSGVILSVFHTGRITISGCNSTKLALRACAEVEPIILMHQCKDVLELYEPVPGDSTAKGAYARKSKRRSRPGQLDNSMCHMEFDHDYAD